MTVFTANHSQNFAGDFSFAYELYQGDTLKIAKDVKLLAAGDWSSVAMLMTGAKLSMEAGAQALSSSTVFAGTGGMNAVGIGKGATVSGGAHAINLDGRHNQIINDGFIKAGYDFADEGHSAILSGGGSYIQNTNWIGSASNYGIMLRDGGNAIMNGNVNVPSSAPVPTITGGYSAIGVEGGDNWINNFGLMTAGGPTIHFMSGEAGEQNSIFNNGRIFSSTGGTAILSQGHTDDRVFNHDTSTTQALIKGNIVLGKGNDYLENTAELYGAGYGGGIVGHIKMGDGNDIVKNTGDITGDIYLGSGNDRLDSSSGRLYQLTNGHDRLPGQIYGELGDDTIVGSRAADVISGGWGQDVLTGGAGKDAFVFDVGVGLDNADVVTDFSVAEDIIYLEAGIFRTINGPFTAEHLCIGSKAADSSDRIVYDPTSGKLYSDQDGTETTYQAQVIGYLDKDLALKASHFFMV